VSQIENSWHTVLKFAIWTEPDVTPKRWHSTTVLALTNGICDQVTNTVYQVVNALLQCKDSITDAYT